MDEPMNTDLEELKLKLQCKLQSARIVAVDDKLVVMQSMLSELANISNSLSIIALRLRDYIKRVDALAAIQQLFPSAPLVTINFQKWQEKEKPYNECMNAVRQILPADVIERREYDAVVAENRFLKAMQAHLTKDMDLTELGRIVAKNLQEGSGADG